MLLGCYLFTNDRAMIMQSGCKLCKGVCVSEARERETYGKTETPSGLSCASAVRSHVFFVAGINRTEYECGWGQE